MTNSELPSPNAYVPEIANVLPPRHSDQRAAAIGLVIGVVNVVASGFSLRLALGFLEGTMNRPFGSGDWARSQAQLAFAYLPVTLISGYLLHSLLARVDPVWEGLWGALTRLAYPVLIGLVAYLYPANMSGELVPVWLFVAATVPGLLIGATRAPLGLAIFPMIFVIYTFFTSYLVRLGLSIGELSVLLPLTGLLVTVASALVLNRLDPAPFTYRDERLMSATAS